MHQNFWRIPQIGHHSGGGRGGSCLVLLCDLWPSESFHGFVVIFPFFLAGSQGPHSLFFPRPSETRAFRKIASEFGLGKAALSVGLWSRLYIQVKGNRWLISENKVLQQLPERLLSYCLIESVVIKISLPGMLNQVVTYQDVRDILPSFHVGS